MFAHPTCPNVPNHCRGNLLYKNTCFFLFHCLLQTNGPPDFQSNIHEKKRNQQTMPWLHKHLIGLKQFSYNQVSSGLMNSNVCFKQMLFDVTQFCKASFLSGLHRFATVAGSTEGGTSIAPRYCNMFSSFWINENLICAWAVQSLLDWNERSREESTVLHQALNLLKQNKGWLKLYYSSKKWTSYCCIAFQHHGFLNAPFQVTCSPYHCATCPKRGPRRVGSLPSKAPEKICHDEGIPQNNTRKRFRFGKTHCKRSSI